VGHSVFHSVLGVVPEVTHSVHVLGVKHQVPTVEDQPVVNEKTHARTNAMYGSPYYEVKVVELAHGPRTTKLTEAITPRRHLVTQRYGG